MENFMSNVTEFPTPRERAGVSMKEDMDNLVDCLMGAMLGLKHSENIAEEDREADMGVLMPLVLKYLQVAGERYPVEDLEE
jgi:hypothetical protein